MYNGLSVLYLCTGQLSFGSVKRKKKAGEKAKKKADVESDTEEVTTSRSRKRAATG